MTYDFFLGQLRVAMVAILAYSGGKGWLTPADATLATALASSLGPLLLPWVWSIVRNYDAKIVPNSAVVAKGAIALFAGFILFAPHAARAADFAVKAPATMASITGCTAQNCSGPYVDFGLLNQNANIVSGGLNGAANDFGLMVGGGYQLWQGSVLAGIQGNIGYEFAAQGSNDPGSKFLGNVMVQLGYNFFPSTVTAATTPGQSPLQNFVPANLLAASTPYLEAGGCLRHGILQGCAGAGIQTVIAASWSAAFDYTNMPSQKGQPDTQVFMLKALKHF